MTHPSAASKHDSPSWDDWRELVEKSAGENGLAALTSQTADQIALSPLYRPAEPSGALSRPDHKTWTVSPRIDHPSIVGAAEQLVTELEGGASGATLICQDSPDAHGYGFDPGNPSELLKPVLADAVRLTLLPSPTRIRDARALAQVLDGHPPHNRTVIVDFGLDAPGLFASTGALRDAVLKGQQRHFSELDRFGFAGTIFRADGRVIHEAGGTPAQELAFVLASLVFMMRATDDPQKALEKTLIGVCVDADQFAGIAKLRAMRALHARLLEVCKAEGVEATIHATSSFRMLTRKDPNVNILRNTTAVFAASVGGADIITSLPHTMALGYSDAFARRLARNVQLILASESNLYRVADPAAGSGLYESYTNALCDKAWAFFQAIEERGGVIHALKSGFIQEAVGKARQALQSAIVSGERKLTGSTVFPLSQEYPVTLLDIEPRPFPEKKGAEHECQRLVQMHLEPQDESA